MKKILYLVPVVVLLAAGCNFAKKSVEQTQNTPFPVNIETKSTLPANNTQTQTTPNPTRASSTETYSNKEYSFSLQYSSDFILKTNSFIPAEMPNYLGRFSSDVAMLSLSKTSIPKNSGVTSVNVLISVADNPVGGEYFFSAVDKSQGVPPPEIRSLELEKIVTVNGIKYGRAVQEGAAAGTQNYIRIYHVFHNAMWYEIQMNVWASSGGNFSQSSTDATWQKLESVLAGFEFTK